MSKRMKYVGLDVHQETTVVAVRDQTGGVMARSILRTEASAIVEFFRGMRGTIYVAFEEGTQAQWLHDLLVPLVADVIVCNRRGEPRQGNKSDFGDAEHISDLLHWGKTRRVYHGSPERGVLKELARTYQNLVEDTSRVMQRIKALFRARGITAPGRRVYRKEERSSWIGKLEDPGVRYRAETLYRELDLLLELRPQAKATMLAEAQKNSACSRLRTIPFLGPVRVALILATMQTPWRFRTKRSLWAYAGFAVVTWTSAEFQMDGGKAVRRRRPARTRGLNRNHNPVLKDVFKSAATAATVRTGALRDLYEGMLARGMDKDLARVTLARKLAAVVLHVWKKGERYDPTKLTLQAR